MKEVAGENDCADDQKDRTKDEVKNECGNMKCDLEIQTPSSGTNRKQNLCESDRAGYCVVHDISE